MKLTEITMELTIILAIAEIEIIAPVRDIRFWILRNVERVLG